MTTTPMARHNRRRFPLGRVLLGLAVLACIVAGAIWRFAPRAIEQAVERAAPVELKVFVRVDKDFERRFGPINGAGGEKVRQWIDETAVQMAREFPIELSLAGTGTWELPHGALDGKAIYDKYVPKEIPAESGANCTITLSGREGIYWSGLSCWPHIFSKAQAAEPIDEKTVSLLCHEISHWFGAVDIIDENYPERSVMNYHDKRFGMVDGKVVWDSRNRKIMQAAIVAWPVVRGGQAQGE